MRDTEGGLTNNPKARAPYSVRLKVTDRCDWACKFCHNSGSGPRNPQVIGDIKWTTELETVLDTLRSILRFDKLQLTGGEPTQHPNLPALVTKIKSVGFRVKATSIGCPRHLMMDLHRASLDGVNFSMIAVDPNLLQNTQVNRSLRWCEEQLDQQMKAILLAKSLGMEVKLNTVVSTVKDYDRVLGVINWAQTNAVPLRLMNDLRIPSQSVSAIAQLCNELGALETGRMDVEASSSFRVSYRLPSGYEFVVKRVCDVYLSQTMCSNCPLRSSGQCAERFYGIRFERRRSGREWELYVRLCLHRTDDDTYMPAKQFLESEQLREISELAST